MIKHLYGIEHGKNNRTYTEVILGTMLTQAASLDDTKPLQKLSYLRLDISVVFRYVIYTY